MKRVPIYAVLTALLITLAGPATFLHADYGQGKCSGGRCPFKQGAQGYGEDSSSHSCPITDKFMTKAHFFLSKQKELGLSEEQVSTMKGLKLKAKKAYLRQMTEFQIFGLDLKEKLSQPKVDTESVNTMIDEFSASMAAFSKEGVTDYVKLKSVLTDAQAVKAKELWVSQQPS